MLEIFVNLTCINQTPVYPEHKRRSKLVLLCVSSNTCFHNQNITDCSDQKWKGPSSLHFCRSRVIGLDRVKILFSVICRMITWVVFLRMFWNVISSLPVKRGGSLSFLVGTISNVESGGYILVSCVHSNTSYDTALSTSFG